MTDGETRIQPTPEDWWAGLIEADRHAFGTAARGDVAFDMDLAAKMQRAGILVAFSSRNGGTLLPHFPEEYAEYARAQERGGPNSAV
jgi:hypothetical protein